MDKPAERNPRGSLWRRVVPPTAALSVAVLLCVALAACAAPPSSEGGDQTPLPVQAVVVARATRAPASATIANTATTVPTAPATQTPPPLATMLRTVIPGTAAPTRVVQPYTPQPEITRGLGDPNLHSDFDTQVAENDAAIRTAAALTPSPTPGSPTATRTPAPTPTETLGWNLCGGAANTYEIQYHEICWQYLWNGRYREVEPGVEGFGSDTGQGLLTIQELGADNRMHVIGTWLTPQREGSVEIAAVDGTRVYLVHAADGEAWGTNLTPLPNYVFVFDLATLQWVSP